MDKSTKLEWEEMEFVSSPKDVTIWIRYVCQYAMGCSFKEVGQSFVRIRPLSDR